MPRTRVGRKTFCADCPRAGGKDLDRQLGSPIEYGTVCIGTAQSMEAGRDDSA